MSTFYNVCSRRIISNQRKEDKKIFHKVGVVKVTNNGGWFLQLYHQPETEFFIFPIGEETLPVIQTEEDDN